MKRTLTLLASFAGAALVFAADPPSRPADAAPAPQAPAITNGVPAPVVNAAPDSASSTNDASRAVLPNGQAAEASGTNGVPNGMLRMNFRGASLEQVLNYLSEAAGFIINVKPNTSVRGKVDVWSSEPLTKEEALNLLDSVLIQNGLAAIHNGRTLTIVNRDEAKTQDVPVVSESNPDRIPRTDRIVTQIIPVRFVEVTQLLKDLTPLVSMNTQITANEAGNAIVITDTQANIRKVAEIIHAIDAGAEDFTEVRVFHLNNSDPTEISELLGNLFPDDSRQGNTQSPFSFNPFFRRFGGFGGRGGGPGGPGGGGDSSGSNNQNQRIKKRNRVVAVADQRTTSVIVSASKDLMEQIAEVITTLDDNPKGRTTVKVFRPENADPQELMQVLQDVFQRNTTQNNRNNNNQNSPLLNRSTTQNQQNNQNNRTGMNQGGNNRTGLGGNTGTFR